MLFNILYRRSILSENLAYLLAITPHPTDIEFGIGGMVARWTGEGKKVVFVICTNGDKGTSIGTFKAQELVAMREKEQLEAAKVLKASEVIFLRHPDLGLEKTPGLGKEILGLILKYKPEIVATCDPTQRYLANPDHRVTGRTVIDAVWPYAMAQNYDPESRPNGECHRVNEILLWQPAEPNYFCDISATFAAKLAAFTCHKSQAGDPILPEFARRFREDFRRAAKEQNYEYGESFHRIEIPAIL
jgi:LmbE family N-acetylglucosaminyl deacetylase